MNEERLFDVGDKVKLKQSHIDSRAFCHWADIDTIFEITKIYPNKSPVQYEARKTNGKKLSPGWALLQDWIESAFETPKPSTGVAEANSVAIEIQRKGEERQKAWKDKAGQFSAFKVGVDFTADGLKDYQSKLEADIRFKASRIKEFEVCLERKDKQIEEGNKIILDSSEAFEKIFYYLEIAEPEGGVVLDFPDAVEKRVEEIKAVQLDRITSLCVAIAGIADAAGVKCYDSKKVDAVVIAGMIQDKIKELKANLQIVGKAFSVMKGIQIEEAETD